jgi:hypothetical protein
LPRKDWEGVSLLLGRLLPFLGADEEVVMVFLILEYLTE